MSIRQKRSFFSKGRACGHSAGQGGFSLLELLVVMAIMAISLSTLFATQSGSLNLAGESRFMIQATFLAQEKLAEFTLSDYRLAQSDSGDFGEEYADLSWSSIVRELSAKETGIPGDEKLLKLIELTVRSKEDPAREYKVRTIIVKEMKALQ